MWPEQQRHSKEEELDEIKHKEKGGYYFTNEKTPIHLAKELDIIKKVFEELIFVSTDIGEELWEKSRPKKTRICTFNAGKLPD